MLLIDNLNYGAAWPICINFFIKGSEQNNNLKVAVIYARLWKTYKKHL